MRDGVEQRGRLGPALLLCAEDLLKDTNLDGELEGRGLACENGRARALLTLNMPSASLRLL